MPEVDETYAVTVNVTNTSAEGGARTFRGAIKKAREKLEQEGWEHVTITACRQVRLPDSNDSAGWGGFAVDAVVTDSADAF